ncbi:MAG: agmatine deiminase family protein [Verrucomicrobiota bacterium]
MILRIASHRDLFQRFSIGWILTFVVSVGIVVRGAEPDSPKSLGFTFPDEWEERQGTMMIFPQKHQYGRDATGLREEFAAIARAIAENEPVTVFCYSSDEEECRRFIGETPNLTIRVGPFSIDWARDTAPMVLKGPGGELASAGFRFNGWGRKYPGWRADVHSRDKISREMGWPIFHSDLVLEGGSIEMAGGIGIVTESSVLNPNRTNWSKEDVENELKEMLSLEEIIWIESGLMPDPITDGHVDGLLKFVSEDTVLLHTTDDRSDVNYQICQDAKKTLLAHSLEVVEVPLAGNVVTMNFYIGSGGSIAYVPVSGESEEEETALEIVRQFFEVVPLKAVGLAQAGGGIHCYTQPIPL